MPIIHSTLPRHIDLFHKHWQEKREKNCNTANASLVSSSLYLEFQISCRHAIVKKPMTDILLDVEWNSKNGKQSLKIKQSALCTSNHLGFHPKLRERQWPYLGRTKEVAMTTESSLRLTTAATNMYDARQGGEMEYGIFSLFLFFGVRETFLLIARKRF